MTVFSNGAVPQSTVFLLSVLQPKLSMAKCRRNVENFLDACKKLGVPQVKNHQHAGLGGALSDAESDNPDTSPMADMIRISAAVHKYELLLLMCIIYLLYY